MGKLKVFERSHKGQLETSLGVQQLRLPTPKARGPGLIPGQGELDATPQLSVQMLQLAILSAQQRPGATKTR